MNLWSQMIYITFGKARYGDIQIYNSRRESWNAKTGRENEELTIASFAR